ncbi:MAG: SpoIIE family protein phosphatase, partial [Firmicutes bacterium]|nr:SpoIIE family protein phosphatase [Bacillota bacterium]
CIVLIMVRPFAVAWEIVSQIAIPFIFINGVGIGILMIIIKRIISHREAEAERNRLRSELELAARIQRSQLPLITDRFPGRDEIRLAASMQPAKEVGGDFYDFFFLDPDHFAIVIADVSGKGIPAALFMIRSKQTIQNCVREEESLAQAIRTANDSLCENNEEELFVTAWVGVLEISTGKLSYVSAGHNPPVLLCGKQAVYVKGKSGLVLGGMEGVPYREGTIDLMPGNKLFLYTDGVTESETENHEQYGEKRLQTCLQESAARTVDEILESVKSDVVDHADGADQFDDMTMMCLELVRN